MAKNKQPLKHWGNFYDEFMKEVEEILGESYNSFWRKRTGDLFLWK